MNFTSKIIFSVLICIFLIALMWFILPEFNQNIPTDALKI